MVSTPPNIEGSPPVDVFDTFPNLTLWEAVLTEKSLVLRSCCSQCPDTAYWVVEFSECCETFTIGLRGGADTHIIACRSGGEVPGHFRLRQSGCLFPREPVNFVHRKCSNSQEIFRNMN